MNPATAMVWVQVGQVLVPLVLSTLDRIKAFASTEGADAEQLARLDVDYAARIARAEQAAQ